MPGIIRAQATFQGATNLPEDRFVGTFHAEWFGQYTDYASGALAWAVSVENFYLVAGSNGRSIANLMSPFISGMTVTTYDMDQPEGEREPTTIESSWVDSGTTNTLPEEVAVCLTLHGAPPITPRRRGRLYLGPLVNDTDVRSNADNTEPMRVNIGGGQSIGATIAAAASTLRDVADLTWAIRSITPVENYVPIVGGWIDNAFDTQRRRGPDPSARLLW